MPGLVLIQGWGNMLQACPGQAPARKIFGKLPAVSTLSQVSAALFFTQHALNSSPLTKHILQHSPTHFCAMAQPANARGHILTPAVILGALKPGHG